MAFGFMRSSSDDDRLENIEAIIQRMLADDRVVFDLAMSILLDGVAWKNVRREIKATDMRVNEGEREVRRDLVVHASVARALGVRYTKRIVAHLANILSAVVMPIDRLDYFDEDPEDRD